MNMHNMCQDNLCFKWSCQTLYTNEQIDYIWIKSLNPLHPNISMHILLTVLYEFLSAGKENFFNNQEVL